ncbi:MAG: MBL fold metallo-hydrolase [Elusimicrobia bacterium]|nr:MBL fold metallo-hydrolase [Elusimicrobiota bacterium]
MRTSAYVRQVPVGPMQNFAYLAGGGAGPDCAVIDPGWDARSLLEAARQDGRAIRAVVLTHGHFDHAGGVKDLLEQAPVPVFAHQGDAAALRAAFPGLRALEDGDTVDAGGLELRCLHTPGHTPGSQCLLAAGQLFTGDTLFIDCCGRTDLPGSDPEAMHRSLRRLAVLPAATVVWPGHDYGPCPSAPLSAVLGMNPYLAAETLQDFLRLGA